MEKEAVGPLPFLPAQTVHHDHPLMPSMLEYVVVALAANAQTKLTSRMENAGIILTKQTPRDLGLPPANQPLSASSHAEAANLKSHLLWFKRKQPTEEIFCGAGLGRY